MYQVFLLHKKRLISEKDLREDLQRRMCNTIFRKPKIFRQSYCTPDFQLLSAPCHHPTIGLIISNPVKLFSTSMLFEKKKLKVKKNAKSRKPKGFQQSNLDARFATIEYNLT